MKWQVTDVISGCTGNDSNVLLLHWTAKKNHQVTKVIKVNKKKRIARGSHYLAFEILYVDLDTHKFSDYNLY